MAAGARNTGSPWIDPRSHSTASCQSSSVSAVVVPLAPCNANGPPLVSKKQFESHTGGTGTVAPVSITNRSTGAPDAAVFTITLLLISAKGCSAVPDV